MPRPEKREAWITVLRIDHGQRRASRHPLNVPLDLATGNLERLSDRALRWHFHDVAAELERRR